MSSDQPLDDKELTMKMRNLIEGDDWACADCAVIWPHLDASGDDHCEDCGGALVDPSLVLAALRAA
ncbi:MAG: hypothetical protein ACR2HQ_13215 [Ilumatobacteraceae bacterium]